MRWKGIIFIIFTIALFGFVAFFSNHLLPNVIIPNAIKGSFANKPPSPVTVAVAEAQEWGKSLQAVGTLQARNGVQVSAQVAGQIREILFQSGQAVKKGQVLVRLDSDVEMSDLRSAQAELGLAETTVARQRALARSGTVSTAALETAEADVKVRNAKVAQLNATIQKKTVLAPFDGVLGVRRVDLGQYVQPGQMMVDLQDLSTMLLDFSVPQKDIAALKVGGPLKLSTDAFPDRSFDGKILAIEPAVDRQTGMVVVQGVFGNEEGVLRPGLFARVEVVLPERERVVAVPNLAVTYNLYGDAVYVVQPIDGQEGKLQAKRVVIELGERRNGMVAVRSGLKGGEQVVTTGQVKIQDGSPVAITETNPLTQQAKR
jgi:membrane fusion protein (multidrug efflux system)